MTSERFGQEIAQENLDALLRQLSSDRGEAGKRYVELRQQLIHLYAWRGCEFPEELADEAMDRVASKLRQGLEIQASDPFRFIKGVAHLVFKEVLRENKRRDRALDYEAWREKSRHRHEIENGAWRHPDGSSKARAGLACLTQCLQDQPPEDRRLIVRYHQGEKQIRIKSRKEMAAELGV